MSPCDREIVVDYACEKIRWCAVWARQVRNKKHFCPHTTNIVKTFWWNTSSSCHYKENFNGGGPLHRWKFVAVGCLSSRTISLLLSETEEQECGNSNAHNSQRSCQPNMFDELFEFLATSGPWKKYRKLVWKGNIKAIILHALVIVCWWN